MIQRSPWARSVFTGRGTTLPSGNTVITISPWAERISARCDTVRNAWVILPSTIDEANGTVTAASGHLSVFQIMQAEPPADAFHFRVGPNPLRAARGQRQMNFLGPAGAEVRIYTLLGELVKDLALAANGTASWDASNRAGQPVASGVYFVHVSADGQSRTYKVMVER